MTTHALIRVYDDSDDVIANIYVHCDGYPTGLGADLKQFLEDCKSREEGCLAAALVARLKTGPGDVYLYPPKITSCGQQFDYEVRLKLEGREVVPWLVCTGGGHQIYAGPAAEWRL